MYAIVNIAGQQYKVEKDQKLFVHRLEEKEGASVSFDEVLLIDNDKSVVVGEPLIRGAQIKGLVVAHPKGDKVQVFKKKKRKGYKVLRGHRQYLTEIEIREIIEKGAVKQAKAKAGTAAKSSEKTTAETKTPVAAGDTTIAKKAESTGKPAAEKTPATEKKTTSATKPAAEKKTTAVKKPAAAKKPATARKATAEKKSTGAKAAPKKPRVKNGDETGKDKK